MAMPLSAVDHPETESMAHLEGRAGNNGDQEGISGETNLANSELKSTLRLVIVKGNRYTNFWTRPVQIWFGTRGELEASLEVKYTTSQAQASEWVFKCKEFEFNSVRPVSLTFLGMFRHNNRSPIPILRHYEELQLRAGSYMAVYDKLFQAIHSGNLPKGVSFEGVTYKSVTTEGDPKDPWSLFRLARTDPAMFEEKYHAKAEEWLTVHERLLAGEPERPAQGSDATNPTSSTQGMSNSKELWGLKESGSLPQKRPPQDSGSSPQKRPALGGSGATNPTGGTRGMLSLEEIAGLEPSSSLQNQTPQGPAATNPTGGTRGMPSLMEIAGLEEPGSSRQEHPRNHCASLHPTLSPAAFLFLSPSYRSSPHSSSALAPPSSRFSCPKSSSGSVSTLPPPLLFPCTSEIEGLGSDSSVQDHFRCPVSAKGALCELLRTGLPTDTQPSGPWLWPEIRSTLIELYNLLPSISFYTTLLNAGSFSLLKSQSPLSLRQNTSTLCLESSFFISVVVDALSSSFNPILTIFTALSTIVLAPKYLPHTSTHLISDSLLKSSRRRSNNAIPSPVLPILLLRVPCQSIPIPNLRPRLIEAPLLDIPSPPGFDLDFSRMDVDEAERAQAELCLCAATLRCLCYIKLREPGDSRDTNLLPRLSNGKSLTLDTRHRGRRIDDAFYELLPLELPHSYFDRKNSARLNVLSNIDQLSRITGIDIYNDKSYNRAAVWFLHSRMSKPLGSGQFQTILEEIANQMDRLKPPAAISETGQAQSHSNTASGDDLTTFIPYHPTDPPNHPQLPIPAASSSSYEH
ncbi:hypothetical protein EV360DRAFT_70856 [Lentinula raphanica]|nr:hypothetical protein EV360DRAFT_70856 [Lentinula raphanica]